MEQIRDFQFTMLALKDRGAVFKLQSDELGKRIQGLSRGPLISWGSPIMGGSPIWQTRSQKADG